MECLVRLRKTSLLIVGHQVHVIKVFEFGDFNSIWEAARCVVGQPGGDVPVQVVRQHIKKILKCQVNWVLLLGGYVTLTVSIEAIMGKFSVVSFLVVKRKL